MIWRRAAAVSTAARVIPTRCLIRKLVGSIQKLASTGVQSRVASAVGVSKPDAKLRPAEIKVQKGPHSADTGSTLRCRKRKQVACTSTILSRANARLAQQHKAYRIHQRMSDEALLAKQQSGHEDAGGP